MPWWGKPLKQLFYQLVYDVRLGIDLAVSALTKLMLWLLYIYYSTEQDGNWYLVITILHKLMLNYGGELSRDIEQCYYMLS